MTVPPAPFLQTGDMCNLAALFTSISPTVVSCPVSWGLPMNLQLRFTMLVWTLPLAGMSATDQHHHETPGALCGPRTISWSGSDGHAGLSSQGCCSPSCRCCPTDKTWATSQLGELGSVCPAPPLHMAAPRTPSQCEKAEPCLSSAKFHKPFIFLIQASALNRYIPRFSGISVLSPCFAFKLISS